MNTIDLFLLYSPLDQFNIYNYFYIDILGYSISITNSTILLFLAIVLIRTYLYLGLYKARLIPNGWQLSIEQLYNFIYNSLVGPILGKKGDTYISFIFTLFILLVFLNLIGMIPYSFTVPSHVIITLSLSVAIFLFVTINAFIIQGISFCNHWFPVGVPIILAPLMIPIEFISYLSRALSLGIRLFANLMSGHALLKILAGFTITMLQSSFIIAIWGIFPILILTALTGLEIIVAVLQAYVFTVLTVMYLKDSIDLSH